VTRLLLCSGKIAVELTQHEARPAAVETAMARLEELYPFPEAELRGLLASYPNLREIVWVQEEPENMGAWRYVAPKIEALTEKRVPLRYVGRPDRASTAEGSAARHALEQSQIIAEALGSGVHVIQCANVEREEVRR
jgi:2-oxoglutarate dehydrogenase E1 component